MVIYIALIIYLLANYAMSSQVIVRSIRHVLSILGLDFLRSGYQFSCVLQFLVLILALVLCLLANPSGVRARGYKHRPFWKALIIGSFLFLYTLLSIESQFMYAMSENYPVNGKGTIFFSSILFLLIAWTEEEIFRGMIADKLFMKAFPEYGEPPWDCKEPSWDCKELPWDYKELPQEHLLDSSDFSTSYMDANEPAAGLVDRRRVWAGVLFSTVLFALAHALNFQTGYLFGVIIQIAGAFVMGFYLAAVYFRTRNLAVVIFLHMINDIAAGMMTTVFRAENGLAEIVGGYGWQNLVVLMPFLVAAVILLRPSKLRESAELWRSQGTE